MSVHEWSTRRMRRRYKPAQGFTLVELMVALIVLGILLGLAVPSFNDASLSSKLTGFANDLVASAQLARSEAIKRNAPVTMCRSTDGTSCAASGGWESGWILLAGATVIEHHQALPAQFRVVQGSFTALTFPPDVVGVTPTTFKVCRASPVGKQERTVRLTTTGTPSVAHTALATCP